MRLEHGLEVVGSSMTFFESHPIPAANPVMVAESVNVFTSLLLDILFWKKNQSIGFTFTGIGGLCWLRLWFWFINESHHLFPFKVESSQWKKNAYYWKQLS